MFEKSNKVQIINYGSLLWSAERVNQEGIKFLDNHDGLFVYDKNPELIGTVGIIDDVKIGPNGVGKYSVSGINGTSWYNENQLKLVTK